jgi:hypothetical protein
VGLDADIAAQGCGVLDVSLTGGTSQIDVRASLRGVFTFSFRQLDVSAVVMPRWVSLSKVSAAASNEDHFPGLIRVAVISSARIMYILSLL